MQALQALGITRGLSFRQLPVVGALATPGATRQLAKRSERHLGSPFEAGVGHVDAFAAGVVASGH